MLTQLSQYETSCHVLHYYTPSHYCPESTITTGDYCITDKSTALFTTALALHLITADYCGSDSPHFRIWIRMLLTTCTESEASEKPSNVMNCDSSHSACQLNQNCIRQILDQACSPPNSKQPIRFDMCFYPHVFQICKSSVKNAF